ncbi:uncharacterized protein LOC122245907 isoform X6 [Penaeus japonicus]|uniref:uncharacterized protein LOC122245907 isoform X6 n=1 Tax=Penaeus japonicus TaxID=27405 RepID=UPI001C70B04C|nr:uncharacterized protein LOC122245907 isoform X6 [Penaeus japonicus]
MILDNRQVPDIIVSREGLSQNNNNNNNARNGNGNGSPRHVGGRNGNGSPRHVNYGNGSPRHVNYGNGSPRHVNYGSVSPRHVNYSSDSPRHVSYVNASPRHTRSDSSSDGQDRSSHMSPPPGFNNNGSPRHTNRNGYGGGGGSAGSGRQDGNGNSSSDSPRHRHHHHHQQQQQQQQQSQQQQQQQQSQQQHLQGNGNYGSPRHSARNGYLGSPRHHSSSGSSGGSGGGGGGGSVSPRHMQRLYSFDLGHGSPRHSVGDADDVDASQLEAELRRHEQRQQEQVQLHLQQHRQQQQQKQQLEQQHHHRQHNQEQQQRQHQHHQEQQQRQHQHHQEQRQQQHEQQQYRLQQQQQQHEQQQYRLQQQQQFLEQQQKQKNLRQQQHNNHPQQSNQKYQEQHYHHQQQQQPQRQLQQQRPQQQQQKQQQQPQPQQQQQDGVERGAKTSSRIPVQVGEKGRDKASSPESPSEGQPGQPGQPGQQAPGSPKRAPPKRGRAHVTSTPVRKPPEPESKAPSDFKSVVKEYSQQSPKRINLRNKNYNYFKYGLCRIEVKDKPTKNWQPWLRFEEGDKWSSPENDNLEVRDKLNTHSTKWNRQHRNWSSPEQEEWGGGGGNGVWNIECDKSEEENDQVFIPDEEERADNEQKEEERQEEEEEEEEEQPAPRREVRRMPRSSSYGRRESWPAMNGNLISLPVEADRGPSPLARERASSPRSNESSVSNPRRSLGGAPENKNCRISSPIHRGVSPVQRVASPIQRGASPKFVNRGSSPRTVGGSRGPSRGPSPRCGSRSSGSLGSLATSPATSMDSRKVVDTETDWDSGVDSVTSKMVLIRCKDANYLTRIYLDKEGIHSLKVVGRVGVGGSAPDHVMNEGQSGAAPGNLHSNHHASSDDVTKFNGDVTGRDNLSENTASLISQATDIEFEHDTADYQWLLDYDLPCARYRESYSREVGTAASLCSGRDGSGRVSVLEPSQGQLQDLSYETLARNLDANLAQIDMDDFHSEDIHNILTLPTMCGEFQSLLQSAEDGEMFASVSGSMMDRYDLDSSVSPRSSSHCDREEECDEEEEEEEEEEDDDEDENDEREGGRREARRRDDELEAEGEEEEYSGVSGELSLYQSGPLFSPLKEPPPLANTTFSVDSLDCDSLHDDLILTCQANKDNYTIAFEGSFVQYSEDSDYHEAVESESSGCSHHWSGERLEGRCSAPSMTHSDEPYTTWSRVSRRSSRTPEVPSRATIAHPQPGGGSRGAESAKPPAQGQSSSKSNSMPNLMRRSLMRRSLEAAGGCVKVFDLQNSMRSSQSSRTIGNEASNFSLVKLFMRQKSLSKEAVSLSSSISQEGACCSSSDNQSNVHDSSDWPMNSQSENDMDGSASPVPPPTLMRQNGVVYHERGFRRRRGSLGAPEITPRTNNVTSNLQDFSADTTTNTATTDTAAITANGQQDGLLNNNNNNIISAAAVLDNNSVQLTNTMDNVTSFEDSLKETSPCSKPPVTSPIREEPEGMDISMDSRGESKVLLDQSEKETKIADVLRLRDNKLNMDKNNMSPIKNIPGKDNGNKNMNKNAFNIRVEERKRSQSPGTPKKNGSSNRREGPNSTPRRRQDSGNSSSGYLSNRGSTEKIRRPSDSDTPQQKPRPKPRVLKQMSDQCLQTSNMKVSATVNTSFDFDKKEVYVYYPNYALPDLGFLKDKKYCMDARVFLVPQHYHIRPEEVRRAREARARRPFSCGDMEKLKKHGFSHIRDWDSLNFLLPKELKEMLLDETECMETTKPSFCQSPKPSRRPMSCDYTPQRYSHELKGSASSNSTQPSSGFRGSSTMLNDSEGENGGLDQRYVYKYDSASTDSEGIEKPPPLPKRSISLPVEERHGPDDPDTPPPRPPLPRGILRKTSSLKEDPSKGASGHNKRYSAIDPGRGNMREDLLKRRSLQEPMEYMAHRTARETIPEVGAQQPAQQEVEKERALSPPSPMGCSCVNQCTGFCGKGLQKKNLLRVSELPDISSHEDLTEDDLLRIRSQVSTFLVTKGTSLSPIMSDVNGQCDLCPKKSVSFAEKTPNAEVPPGGLNADGTEEDPRPMVYDAHDKKTLVLSVRAAVEKLVTHFAAASSQQEKIKLGTSSLNPTVAQIALEKLCPAVYALLSDGLHPSLHSLFGKINNSVWRVVEVTSQISPSTKALNDLVLTLNSEECLSEGPIKFNAFIFGLLNIRSLDSWMSYLRTRESIIQKHYHPEAFLYLSNTATRSLYDDLLIALRPLAILPFNLDLLHEYKALHASLQKMEERLLQHTKESPGERPPSVLDHLLASKETKEFKNAVQQDRVKALMRVLTSPDLDENELLQSITDHTRERSRSPRPRSCYEHVANEEQNTTLRKRWSGVQLGSRLLTAIDKLMLEEAGPSSSEDYTDSIDNPKNNQRPSNARGLDCSEENLQTDLKVSDISSRDGDISERSASEKDTENEKGARACANNDDDDEEPEGVRFRRLQLKWEQMAGPEKKAPPPAKAPAPPTVPEKAVSPSSGSRSRIPRPVSMTSPQRPFKPFDPSKEKTSPQIKPALMQKQHLTTAPKELPKPAPRRSLKDKSSVQSSPDEASNAAVRPPSVRSRLAPRPNSVNLSLATGRASSVPGRVPNAGDKTNNASGRLVQTLHHRLATDNGHLSFNRGDILTLVVEVDDRYLLCCHNDRKGLVPRSSVIVYEA